MSLIALDQTNFNDVINDNPTVLISFHKAGEEHSAELTALMDASSAKHPDVIFATCDIAAVPEAAQSFHITVVPTVIAFREQHMLFTEPSAKRSAWLRSQERLDAAVSRIKQIDSDMLREVTAAGGAALAPSS